MISESVGSFLTSFLVLGLFSATSAETRSYKDKRLHYGLELPSQSWRIVKRSGIAPRTELSRFPFNVFPEDQYSVEASC